LFDAYHIQNGLKEQDSLSRLLFNLALDSSIRKVKENREELKLNRTLHRLVSVGDVNLLSENVNNVRRATGTQLDAS
jgi:hypothetical protein